MTRTKNREKPAPSSITNFLNGMRGHTAVENIEMLSEQLYRINRKHFKKPPVTVFVVDLYVASEADVVEIRGEYPDIDAIVMIGFYNTNSWAAKEMGKKLNLGLFTFREFFGALNFTEDKFLNYELKHKD